MHGRNTSMFAQKFFVWFWYDSRPKTNEGACEGEEGGKGKSYRKMITLTQPYARIHTLCGSEFGVTLHLIN